MRTVRNVQGLLTMAIAIVGFQAALNAAENTGSLLRARRKEALDSIKADDLRNHANFLSSDTLEGRGAGTRGGRAASIYLAEQFKKKDLAGGAGPSSYIQEFSGEMRNVLGIIPGRDPTLKDEYIVVCGHFDHVGYGSGATGSSLGPTGHIHNGADDNASGVSTILEILEAFRELKVAPRRSVLFAFWDGEEIDLLGSKHWVANPTVPLSQVKFVVNMDMVGRLKNDKVELIGTRTATGLRELMSRHNQTSLLTVDFPWDVPDNSDHHVFYARQIPILMPFTGFHDDYHRPSDDPDKLNYEGMQRIGQLMFSLLLDLSESEEAVPTFRSESLREKQPEQTAAEADAGSYDRLGVTWLSPGEDQKGVLVGSVYENSLGGRGGLQEGDRVLKWNGNLVDARSIAGIVQDSESGVELSLVRRGETDPQALKLDLSGVAQRFGMTWREDRVEPGTMVVSHIEPGSPAALAGIRNLDRLYGIDAERTKSTDQFLAHPLLKGKRGEILLERGGRFYSVVLQDRSERP